MDIRLTLGRKNLRRDFSSRDSTCFIENELHAFFKEIKPRISLKNISLISILQKFNDTLRTTTAPANVTRHRRPPCPALPGPS